MAQHNQHNQLDLDALNTLFDEVSDILIRDGFGGEQTEGEIGTKEEPQSTPLNNVNKFFHYADQHEHVTTIGELFEDLNFNKVQITRVVETVLGLQSNFEGAEYATVQILKNPHSQYHAFHRGVVSVYKCQKATTEDMLNILTFVEDLLAQSTESGVAAKVAVRRDFNNGNAFLGRIDITFIDYGASSYEQLQVLYQTKLHDWYMRF